MSTNSECVFIEVAPGQWWYVLEDFNAPKNAWDWREHAQAFGPFATEDTARDDLFSNHANPGGWSTYAFREGYKPDPVMARLMTEAKERNAS